MGFEVHPDVPKQPNVHWVSNKTARSMCFDVLMASLVITCLPRPMSFDVVMTSPVIHHCPLLVSESRSTQHMCFVVDLASFTMHPHCVV